MTIVVWSIGQATYVPLRLESLNYRSILFHTVEDHQEGLQLTLFYHWRGRSRLLTRAGQSLSRDGFVVFASEENLSGQLLRGPLLRVKLSILPVQSWHRDEVNLLHFER